MLTIISILLFAFILFLIFLFGKRYYDGIGLTKIEEEGEQEEEDDTKPDFYDNDNRDSYFSDEVIDCQETIAEYDTCQTIGQDLVTVLQHPMNGGRVCTEKVCRNTDVYDCRAHGKERGVFIQRRSDNKFLNYKLVPCADYDDICISPTTLTADECEEFKCKNTDIKRLETSGGVKWDIKMDWEDYNVVGYATSWILKILPIDDSNRDSFQLYAYIKSDEYNLDTVLYLNSSDNVLSKNNIRITLNEKYFKTHTSEGSEGINLVCEEDNTQLIVYEPVYKACTTLGEPVSFTFIKRKSDGKYLVVKGPKLLDYYADRAKSGDGVQGTGSRFYGNIGMASRSNTTSFHEFCIDGDNYHISYTDDINKATGISIEKSGTTISLKLEFEVTNFEINTGTHYIGDDSDISYYLDPHKVTKYLELVDGNISLCNNWKYTTWTWPIFSTDDDYTKKWHAYDSDRVIGLRPENAPNISQSDAEYNAYLYGSWSKTKLFPSDLVCSIYKDPISYSPLEHEQPDTNCFYGSQNKIDISTSLFEQNYELVESITIRIGNEPKNCKEKTEQEQECEKDYKKCTSYEEFFPYHGNNTGYSFGE